MEFGEQVLSKPSHGWTGNMTGTATARAFGIALALEIEVLGVWEWKSWLSFAVQLLAMD